MLHRLVITLAFSWVLPAMAIIQTENFDTNWATFSSSSTAYTNLVNPISGWSISNATIWRPSNQASVWSASNACALANNGAGWVMSPFLSNGVGSLTFYSKTLGGTEVILMEYSYDGALWATNTAFTNSSTWASFANTVNTLSNQFVRLRRIDAGAFACSIDNITITTPAPVVTLSNLSNTPASPADQESVTISANATIQSVYDTLAITNYWREWPSTSWTNLVAMTANGPNLYTNIIPGKAIGTLVEYYARATYASDGITYTTNSISTNSYLVIPKSSYTNLAVTGQLNAALRNGANYQWQGVIQVTNNNPTFQFRGTSSTVTNNWGDLNQSITNIPLYGTAEVTNNNITLNTTNNGYYLFAFNETNLDYSVRSCSYENFNTWTNLDASTPTPSTNSSTGWVLVSGNTSNDPARIFTGTGRSAIVETNGWLQTPYLSNGIGQISLWCRNWSTTGAPTGTFTIQTSDSNAVTWTTIGTVSNIVSTNFLFFSVPKNDIASKYVRIQNTQTTATARLCFDEVVIAQAGAGVNGISATPTNTTILDPVTIAIDLTPYNGAVIGNVTVWYRFGTNGVWSSAPMSSTNGSHYALTNQFSGLPDTLSYAIKCDFDGFSDIKTIDFPSSGTSSPYSVSVTPVPNSRDNRFENFDTNWPTYSTSSSIYTNLINPVSGWSISNATIWRPTAQANVYSPSNACTLKNNGEGWVRSPFLTNGVGSVMFYWKASNVNQTNLIESSYNGADWFTNAILTHSSTTYTPFTNFINSLSNQYVRIRRTDPGALSDAIEDIRITYPPANVAITNILFNPGYPVAGQTFTASCDVVSLNPYFPAYNIAPVFTYWTGGGVSNAPMIRAWVSGITNHYILIVSLASIKRDTLFSYYVRATFDGYFGSVMEDQSPRISPTNTFVVRAFSSPYSNVSATVNGVNTAGRLLTNGLWQTIISGSSSSTNFSLAGLGYSSGSGYATNDLTIGNSNNWQTTVPLADIAAGTNTIPANLTSGQFVVRYDEATGMYIVQRCVWQDFDKPGEGDGTLYKQTVLSGAVGGAQQNFDTWTTNATRSRFEDFEGSPWTSYTNSVTGVGGGTGYLIYSGTVVNVGGAQVNVMQTTSNVNPAVISDSFIAQGSHWGQYPLRGIGQISYNYAATRTNVPAQIAVYLADTNNYPEPVTGDTNSYMTFKYNSSWQYNIPPVSLTTNITNTAYASVTTDLNTNITYDIVFAHISGTQSLRFASVSVNEWYAEAPQTNSDGWVGAEYWIEASPDTNHINVCRLDVTRANNKTNQFIRSPRISSGIKYIEFYYSGVSSLSQNPPTNVAVNFTVEQSDNPLVWTNTPDTISTNFINNTAGTNYYRYFRSLQNPQQGLYIRIKNATPKPGALLLDSINIPAYATTNDWYINNIAIDYKDQTYPPWPRQYFRGVAYLNNTRSGSSLATGTEFPDTNSFPQVRTPGLAGGIGEISFRYRNWGVSAPIYPAKLVIQAAPILTGHESDWTTTIATITNIVNTNDYLYFSTSIYDTNNIYVRIYNDDTYTNNVGRVCLDDILVTAPLASSLTLSNLVITPATPLYTNTVDISVDVYRLFFNPMISDMTVYYASASSYTGLASATPTALPMTCISTNRSALGGLWYRYLTSPESPIPAHPSDTFVKYSAQATFSGYHTEITSPTIQKAFATHPRWLAPLDTQYPTAQAYYVVLSCPTGSVWINEINVQDISDYWDPPPKYIELCGIANVNLLDWRVQILSPSGLTQEVYIVTNSFTIPNNTNGFGFFILGDSITSNRNITLTNAYANATPSPGALPYEGGVRLIRKSGIYADAVAYAADASYVSALTNSGFIYAGDDSISSYNSLSLLGTGSQNNAFTWANTVIWSAGSQNDTQILLGIAQESVLPTNVTISAFQINTSNIWIECTGGTEGWGATPWYSTNLLNTNGWVMKTPFTSSLSPSNTYQLNFARTNLTPCFYRIVVTNGP